MERPPTESPLSEKKPEIPSEDLQALTEYVASKASAENMRLIGSQGSLLAAGKRAYEDMLSGENHSGMSLLDLATLAIDKKAEELIARSDDRFKISGITDTERKDLYQDNPNRSSTRFKGLKS